MPEYVLKRRLHDGRRFHEPGTVMSFPEADGDKAVRNGWAERKPGRPRKAKDSEE